MTVKNLVAMTALAAAIAPVAHADVSTTSRNSTINVGLITVGPPAAPASSTLVDSAADLFVSGSASYADGFGRDFFATYEAAQDVEFGASGLSGSLTQSANTVLNNAGFPASTVFSVDVFNRYESAFTVSEDTTLRVTLTFTGTVTLTSAADRVDFRINTDFGGLYVMPLAVPGGQYTNESLAFDVTFLANTNYYLVAEGRAFSGGGDGMAASELSFSLAPVPAPSALAMVALVGAGAATRRRR